ncbi:hypothetical protein HDE_14549 [Halotydeus destructor]|nr:hypothetical protein HDE_14549 [Halotydeus destructor]
MSDDLMITNWLSVLRSGRDSDLTIVCGDHKKIKVHKLVLAVKGVRLRSSKGFHYLRHDSNIVWKVLSYIYTDHVDLDSIKEALDMFEVAKYFGGLLDLRARISDYIQRSLTDENWTKCIILSFSQADALLYDMCKNHMIKRRRGLKCYPDWRQLFDYPHLLARLLDELTQENELLVPAQNHSYPGSEFINGEFAVRTVRRLSSGRVLEMLRDN